MSTTVQFIRDPAWLVDSSRCLEKHVVGKTEDVLDLFARQNSWEVDQDLIGGVDGWQLLPLVEEDLAEPWLVGQDYGAPFVQSFTSSVTPATSLLTSNQYETSAVQQELNGGELEQAVRYTDDILSFDQQTTCSWLDKAMLEELSVLVSQPNSLSTRQYVLQDDQQFVIKDDQQQYDIKDDPQQYDIKDDPQQYDIPMEDDSSFIDDTSCVTVPSTVELADLIKLIDGPVVGDQIYQESSGEIYRDSLCLESVESSPDWIASTQSNDTSPWQENEGLLTSCENSDFSFSEDDSSEDEDFVPSTKSMQRKTKKHVKRCSVRREEYARLSLSQRRERKKEQNKNAATKYREKNATRRWRRRLSVRSWREETWS